MPATMRINDRARVRKPITMEEEAVELHARERGKNGNGKRRTLGEEKPKLALDGTMIIGIMAGGGDAHHT